MFIYLFKNSTEHITGFQSHIQHPEKWAKDNLREIPDDKYQTLFFFLTGREHIKEVNSGETVRFGELKLRDEGDLVFEHLKDAKKIFKD